MNSSAALARQAGMTDAQWKEAVKFDSTDWGWIIMSIGMAIGAGIVFLPVQVGLVGVWVYLFSAIIAYPAIYLLQRLFINTLADSPRCEDYPSVISGYLGKNWGFLLGILYFLSILICVFMYSTALTNDSASFLFPSASPIRSCRITPYMVWPSSVSWSSSLPGANSSCSAYRRSWS